MFNLLLSIPDGLTEDEMDQLLDKLVAFAEAHDLVVIRSLESDEPGVTDEPNVSDQCPYIHLMRDSKILH
jgi:hypothetical protein